MLYNIYIMYVDLMANIWSLGQARCSRAWTIISQYIYYTKNSIELSCVNSI